MSGEICILKERYFQIGGKNNITLEVMRHGLL